MLSYFIDKLPASWKAGLMEITYPLYQKFGVRLEMDKVYQEFGVGRTSAYEAARLLVSKMEAPQSSLKEERKRNRELQKSLNKKSFYAEILVYREEQPSCWIKGERHQFTDEFKAFVLSKKKEYDLDWTEISELLNIPEDTLKKFKRSGQDDNDDNGPGPINLPENVLEILRMFFKSRSEKATVKSFCEKHPEVLHELKLDYRQLSRVLWQMGFVSPRGIFLNNTGLDRIERFSPHAVWGTDGKQMVIVINGEEFRWVWQCLIDYKTTVLVGGLIGKTETTPNLLEAIKRSREFTGVTPMAIVIDGRLSENLPAIRSYLDELGIAIIKTFPGNPKSNGIIEGNFNIFEKWVGGRLVINGDTVEKLSFSIAEMLTEVFTQLRNNQPRKSLSSKSANEVSNEAIALTDEEKQSIRDKLNALATRLKNEQAKPLVSERKTQALNQAVDELKPPSADVFRKRLASSIFTPDLILAALGIFKKQQVKHPEKQFDHTYFGGILRNLVDKRSVEQLYVHLEQTYTDHWRRMNETLTAKNLAVETPVQACERLGEEYLKAKVPAHGLLALAHLHSMFVLASCGCREKATEIRKTLGETVMKWKLNCSEKRMHLLQNGGRRLEVGQLAQPGGDQCSGNVSQC